VLTPVDSTHNMLIVEEQKCEKMIQADGPESSDYLSDLSELQPLEERVTRTFEIR